MDTNGQRQLTATPPVIWLLMALPVLVHFTLLFLYEINVPRLDDFSETLVFLSRFANAVDAREKLELFFGIYRGHRHTLYHLASLLHSPVNFRFLSIAGNIFLLIYVVLFAIAFKRQPQRQLLLLLSVYLVFNLQAWRGMFWPIGTWGTQNVLILAFLTFTLCLRHKKITIYPAIATAVITTFTYANGIFVWPVVALFLLSEQNWRITRKAQSLHLWCLAGAITLSLFFYDYHSGTPSISATTWTTESLLHTASNLIKSFLAIPGSILLLNDVNYPWRANLSIVLGMIEIATLLWLLLRGALRKKPELLMLLAFSILTLLTIAATRALTGGIDQSLQGHYKLYNSTLLLLLSVAINDWVLENKPTASNATIKLLTAAVITLYTIALALFIPMLTGFQSTLTNDTRQWLYSHTLLFSETRLYVPAFNKKLENAIEANIYDPWSLIQKTEKPLATDSIDCPTGLPAIQADLTSHKLAEAVLLTMDSATMSNQLYLCSPLQGIRITLTTEHYYQNKNGTYSLKLWVPRNRSIEEDSGPWKLYRAE